MLNFNQLIHCFGVALNLSGNEFPNPDLISQGIKGNEVALDHMPVHLPLNQSALQSNQPTVTVETEQIP